MAERDFDVVVFGATSVTGRRVCAYLDEREASWAAAARDAGKAKSVLGECGVSAPETIVADIGDDSSLAAMASRARVVLNLVGPYTLYGRPVIAACVEGGAHYVDLTGEIPFARRVIDEFDSPAGEAGVKVVEVSGFEALPADLGVALAAQTAHERHDEPLASADLELEITGMPWPPKPSDVLSGGTMQSMAAIAAGDERYDFKDPACLIADPAEADRVRGASPISVAPRGGSTGAPLAPMQPAAYINPAVIHRSTALRGDPPLRYREGVRMPGPPPVGWAAAGAVSSSQLALAGVAAVPAGLRKRLSDGMASVLPSSGFGPSADRLEGWEWSMAVSGRTRSGREVGVEIDGEGHPGYLATARMLGEAGLILAGGTAPDRAGCLTPAAALGVEDVQRFSHARLGFTVLP